MKGGGDIAMTSADIRFWKSNHEWYDYDENDEPYLTEKAPPEARESFEKLMEFLKEEEQTGIHII